MYVKNSIFILLIIMIGTAGILVHTQSNDPWYVARVGNVDQLIRLLEKGLDLSLRDSTGNTLLMEAARNNPDAHVIQYLIDAGSDLDARNKMGWTPLMCAIKFNRNPGVITTLIEAGAPVNVFDNLGHHPLGASIRYNQKAEMISLLFKAGAFLPEEDADEDLLIKAARFNTDPDVFSLLVKRGYDINVTTAHGQTPLMKAALYTANPDVITRLLALGADPRSADETGLTAFDYAKRNKDLKNTAVYWKLNEAAY